MKTGLSLGKSAGDVINKIPPFCHRESVNKRPIVLLYLIMMAN